MLYYIFSIVQHYVVRVPSVRGSFPWGMQWSTHVTGLQSIAKFLQTNICHVFLITTK